MDYICKFTFVTGANVGADSIPLICSKILNIPCIGHVPRIGSEYKETNAEIYVSLDKTITPNIKITTPQKKMSFKREEIGNNGAVDKEKKSLGNNIENYMKQIFTINSFTEYVKDNIDNLDDGKFFRRVKFERSDKDGFKLRDISNTMISTGMICFLTSSPKKGDGTHKTLHNFLYGIEYDSGINKDYNFWFDEPAIVLQKEIISDAGLQKKYNDQLYRDEARIRTHLYTLPTSLGTSKKENQFCFTQPEIDDILSVIYINSDRLYRIFVLKNTNPALSDKLKYKFDNILSYGLTYKTLVCSYNELQDIINKNIGMKNNIKKHAIGFYNLDIDNIDICSQILISYITNFNMTRIMFAGPLTSCDLIEYNKSRYQFYLNPIEFVGSLLLLNSFHIHNHKLIDIKELTIGVMNEYYNDIGGINSIYNIYKCYEKSSSPQPMVGRGYGNDFDKYSKYKNKYIKLKT